MQSGLCALPLMQQHSAPQRRPYTPLWLLEETTPQTQARCRADVPQACLVLTTMSCSG